MRKKSYSKTGMKESLKKTILFSSTETEQNVT